MAVVIKVDREVFAQIKERQDRTGETPSQIIREWIRDLRDKREAEAAPQGVNGA